MMPASLAPHATPSWRNRAGGDVDDMLAGGVLGAGPSLASAIIPSFCMAATVIGFFRQSFDVAFPKFPSHLGDLFQEFPETPSYYRRRFQDFPVS